MKGGQGPAQTGDSRVRPEGALRRGLAWGGSAGVGPAGAVWWVIRGVIQSARATV